MLQAGRLLVREPKRSTIFSVYLPSYSTLSEISTRRIKRFLKNKAWPARKDDNLKDSRLSRQCEILNI
jgi:hypothetical protein